MKYSEFSTTGRRSPAWIKLASASLIALAIAGCGGGGTGANTTTTPVSVGSNATEATAATVATWKALAPQITVNSVAAANGIPVVQFTVKDAAGNPVIGLGNYTQNTSTAIVHSLANMSFTMAKLVPGANGDPSKWVSYLVTKPVTVAQSTAGATIAATASCNQVAAVPATSTTAAVPAVAATWCGTFPSADNQGTLVDNGDGSYKYTFYRDLSQVKAIAAGLNDSTDGLSKKADLGDLTFDPTLTHRLGIMITGNAPGTGTNTNSTSGKAYATAAVPIVNPANFTYDFIPATGAAVTSTDASRDIVNIATCASCHQSKPLAHGGSRGNPQLCVTCHTDQVKYSFNLANGIPMDPYGNLTGGVSTSNSTQQNRAEQAILDGRAVGNFPNYMHKLHMGTKLIRTGYNYNVDNGAMLFNQNQYPQDIRNCTTCHDGAATGAKAVKDGNNWYNVPSALACGSCHDGISFVTGKGYTMADKNLAATNKVALSTLPPTNHATALGLPAANKDCATCHTPAANQIYHGNVKADTGITGLLPRSPVSYSNSAALRTLSATIKGVVVDANGGVTVTFGLTKSGVAVTSAADFKSMAITLAKLVPAGDSGAPSYWESYLARAKSSDPVNQPPVIQGYSELAQTAQTAIACNSSATPAVSGRPALAKGLLTAPTSPSTDWTYKFALVNGGGDIRNVTTAQNVTATADCTSVRGFTVTPTLPNVVSYDPTLTHRVGIQVQDTTALGADNLTNATFDFVPAGGAPTVTRNIVTMDNCATCHAGRKIHRGYATEYCVTCHNQKTADPWFGDQTHTVELMAIVHKIHDFGAGFTVNNEQFGSAASGNAGFPGLVQNCQACHVETNAKAKDAALWRTNPNARSCGSCHGDNPTAVAHMNAQIDGGTVANASGLKEGGVETCVLCHGPSSTLGVDVKTVHAKAGSAVTH